MYQFSRAIYRELAPDVIDVPGSSANSHALLAACETVCQRLASDAHFARPTRTLFREVRIYFPIERQWWAYAVISRHLELAAAYLEQIQAAGRMPDGSASRCHATTRRGVACRREPLPGLEHCPSHRHLEEAPRLTAA